MEKIGFIGLGRMDGQWLEPAQERVRAGRVRREPGAGQGPGSAGCAGGERRCRHRPGQRRRHHHAAEFIEVESTVLSADGVLANSRPGQVVMDMSTVEPQTTDRLAAAAAARGLTVVDAPSAAWRLMPTAANPVMVGASDADFRRVCRCCSDGHDDPSLRQGRHRHPYQAGEQLSRHRVMPVERRGARLVAALRLDLPKTLEVLYGTTATNGQLRVNWPNKVLPRYDPRFTIDLAHKDLSIILAASQTAKVPAPVGAAAREVFTAARARGHGGADFSSIVDAFCEMAGVEKPRLPAGWKAAHIARGSDQIAGDLSVPLLGEHGGLASKRRGTERRQRR